MEYGWNHHFITKISAGNIDYGCSEVLDTYWIDEQIN